MSPRRPLLALCFCAALAPLAACSPVIRSLKSSGNTVTYYTAEGGVVIRGGTKSAYSMCVMPPSQGVRQRTGKGEGKLVVKANETTNIDMGGEGGAEHKTQKLYEHTDATLFMQHGLYRVCEMALNGGFDVWEMQTVTRRGNEVTEAVPRLDPNEYQKAVNNVLKKTAAIIMAQKAEARRGALSEIATIFEETRLIAEKAGKDNPDLARATAKAIEGAGAIMRAVVAEGDLEQATQNATEAARKAQAAAKSAFDAAHATRNAEAERE